MLKEPIERINMLTIVLVLVGLIFIVQPPFLFGQKFDPKDADDQAGQEQRYSDQPKSLTAVLVLVFSATVLAPAGNVALRALKSILTPFEEKKDHCTGFFCILATYYIACHHD